MGRPKLINPTVALNVHLDARLKARMDEVLFSELEERVPFGAYQKFFNLILTQALTFKTLDLAPFLGTDPGTAIVRGETSVVERLKAHLEQR